MSVKQKVIEIFENKKGIAISGEEIANTLNVSRNSVWKAINDLKKDGYKISASTNKGYILSLDSDVLSKEGILANLKTNIDESHIIYKKETESTNKDLLELAQSENDKTYIEVALTQSKGRGRIGREFKSPDGGLYFSVLLNVKSIPMDKITLITPMAAVAVYRAIKKTTGKDLSIKWVNDLYYKEKKICGILTQASLDMESNTISSVVIGIGIDYQIDVSKLDDSLKNVIGTIYEPFEEKSTSKNKVVACVVDELIDLFNSFNIEFLKEYRENNFILGKEISFEYNNEMKYGKAISIEDNAALKVQLKDGSYLLLNSGEVSVKF